MDVGELLINIRIKTEALEQGLNEVKKQLKTHEQEMQSASGSYDKFGTAVEKGLNKAKEHMDHHNHDVQMLGMSYQMLSVSVGLSFAAIVTSIKKGIDAYNNFNNSMVGLKSIVQGTGNDFNRAQKSIENFTSDGLIPVNNAATALKNLLSRGFGMDEAVDILNRLKDAAAFGRQASLSLGEAVQSATEGLKNENSILVDNAGVTKNVSKMWEEYAKSIGKGADSLSQSEKRQAEYIGILKETQHQVGDAVKYSQEFSGAQARASAETLKLSQALGSGIAPILNTILGLITPLISGLTGFVSANKELAGGLTIATAMLLGFITVLTAVKASVIFLKPAIDALKLSFISLATNPVVLALTALAVVVGVVAVQVQKARQQQELYNAKIAEHNKLVKDGITKTQVSSVQSDIDKLRDLSARYDDLNKKIKEQQEIEKQGIKDGASTAYKSRYGIDLPSNEMNKYTDQLKKLNAEMKEQGVTEKNIIQVIKEKESAIRDANRVTIEEFNNEAKNIAQKHTAVLEAQNLIDAYKNAEKGTSQFYDAQKKLADLFPQFASNSGIAIGAIQNYVNAQDAAAKAEFKIVQARARIQRIDLQNTVKAEQLKVQALFATLEIMDAENIRTNNILRNAMSAKEKLDALEMELQGLRDLENIDIDQVTGVKPPDYSAVDSANKAYENKAYNDALRLYEHRKYLNQLTLEDEVRILQDIGNRYARSAEEKMEIEEKLYSARESIRERDRQAIEESIAAQEKLLQEKDQDFIRQIDRKKLYSQINGDEEIKQYQALIQYHKDYLDKILTDERISVEEKNRIRRQETQTISDTEDKIFNIRKSYIEKAVNEYISAKQKQYDQEEAIENDRLNKKLAALDKEYSDREKEMKTAERTAELQSLYEEERKFANAATKEGQDRLKEIRAQIAALNKEAEKERLEAEKESQKAGIEAEIEANKSKYKALREELENAQKEMLAAASAFAEQSTKAMEEANKGVADALYGIFKTFDASTSDLMTKGLQKLQTLATAYSNVMSSITFNPANLGFGTAGNLYLPTQQNVTVNVTDNGDKYIDSKDEVIDYTNELFNTARNAIRASGG